MPLHCLFNIVPTMSSTCVHGKSSATSSETDRMYVLNLNTLSPSILGEVHLSGFSEYIHSINSNNTLLITIGWDVANTVRISLVDATDPGFPEQLHNLTVKLDDDNDAWSSSDVIYDYKAFRWLSLADGVGLAILPVRIESWDQSSNGNYDGFYVYEVSRNGINLRLNVSHVDSASFYGCYPSTELPTRSMVFNGNLTTMKGHSVLSTDLDSGELRWKYELSKPANDYVCSCW